MPTAPRLRSALALACLLGCGKHHSEPKAEAIPMPIAITIDGELREPPWNALAPVYVFEDHGAEARPYSHLRVLHDPTTLYLGLYAADQDIRSTEHFDLQIGAMNVTIDPRGALTPAIPGARAAADLDGTVDDPKDEDEEWVIELALPLPAGPFALRASRCDTPKDGIERCGTWTSPAPLTLR